MPLAAVGFDLDDTLCSPVRDRASLLEAAAAAVDAPPVPEWTSRAEYQEAHQANLTSRTRAPVFEAMLDGTSVGTDPSALATAYREQVNEALQPLDGVERMIGGLRERYRVGLLTNGPQLAQREKLAALGWDGWFDVVVISGEAGAGKPDGAAFDALLDALRSDAGETAYVGDEVEADVAGAAAAGLYAVQVCYPGGPAPTSRAVAHVDRSRLATDLPLVLDSL